MVQKIEGVSTLAEPNGVFAAMMAPSISAAAAKGCPPSSLAAAYTTYVINITYIANIASIANFAARHLHSQNLQHRCTSSTSLASSSSLVTTTSPKAVLAASFRVSSTLLHHFGCLQHSHLLLLLHNHNVDVLRSRDFCLGRLLFHSIPHLSHSAAR